MRLDVVGLLHRAQSVTLVLGPYMRAACLPGGGEAQVDCASPDFARDMHPPTWSALMTGQKALTEQQPAVVEPTEKTYPIVPASSAPTPMVHFFRRDRLFLAVREKNRVVAASYSVSCSVRACALVRVGRLRPSSRAVCHAQVVPAGNAGADAGPHGCG